LEAGIIPFTEVTVAAAAIAAVEVAITVVAVAIAAVEDKRTNPVLKLSALHNIHMRK
jgi:hypothetical protein